MKLLTQKRSAGKRPGICGTGRPGTDRAGTGRSLMGSLAMGRLATGRPLTQAVLTFFFAACLASLFWSGAVIVHAQQTSATASGSPTRQRGSRVADQVAEKERAHPFESGEELLYVAEFSRALLKKLDVAEFRLTAAREPATEEIIAAAFSEDASTAPYQLKFTGVVSSKGFFTKLFNLRFKEQIESTVDPASFTVTRTKKVDEQGKRLRTSETTYRDGKVLWIEKDPNSPSRPPRSAEATFVGQVQDVLSAIYYLRTQRLELGKTFELTVSDSGNVYQVPVRVVEKKRMKTVLGRLEALRVDPEIFGAKGMIDEKGSFSIWLTNDKRHIPVSARIKTEYGTFEITLRKVTQNKLPTPAVAAVSPAR
jgi:hypothetical protein